MYWIEGGSTWRFCGEWCATQNKLAINRPRFPQCLLRKHFYYDREFSTRENIRTNKEHNFVIQTARHHINAEWSNKVGIRIVSKSLPGRKHGKIIHSETFLVRLWVFDETNAIQIWSIQSSHFAFTRKQITRKRISVFIRYFNGNEISLFQLYIINMNGHIFVMSYLYFYCYNFKFFVFSCLLSWKFHVSIFIELYYQNHIFAYSIFHSLKIILQIANFTSEIKLFQNLKICIRKKFAWEKNSKLFYKQSSVSNGA